MDEANIVTGCSPEETLASLASLPTRTQLQRVLELLSATDQRVEHLGRLTSQLWEYIVANELWRAGSMTQKQLKERIDWPAISDRIIRFKQTQKRKYQDSRGITKAWGCTPEEALGGDMWPGTGAASHLLQNLHRLSKICGPQEARSLLADTIRQRANKPGSLRWVGSSHLLAVDVTRVIQQLQAGGEGMVLEEKLGRKGVGLGLPSQACKVKEVEKTKGAEKKAKEITQLAELKEPGKLLPFCITSFYTHRTPNIIHSI